MIEKDFSFKIGRRHGMIITDQLSDNGLIGIAQVAWDIVPTRSERKSFGVSYGKYLIGCYEGIIDSLTSRNIMDFIEVKADNGTPDKT